MAKSGPQARRIAAVSSGDATTPSSPASWAILASATTCSSSGRCTPTLASVASSMLVSTVTPMTSGAAPAVPRRGVGSRPAPPPASSARRPTRARSPSTPRSRPPPPPPAPRCSGCRGTSGRGTPSMPVSTSAGRAPGPSSVNSRLPTLTPPTRSRSSVASSSARARRVHVERD